MKTVLTVRDRFGHCPKVDPRLLGRYNGCLRERESVCVRERDKGQKREVYLRDGFGHSPEVSSRLLGRHTGCPPDAVERERYRKERQSQKKRKDYLGERERKIESKKRDNL